MSIFTGDERGDLDEKLLGNCRIFHFGSLSMTHETCRKATQKAVAIAKTHGAVLSFDPNLREPLWKSLKEAKERFFLSEKERVICMNVSEAAKLAGVSNAAVSRYFNNEYISQEKREAIRKAVEETGYRPSLQAQTLRTKKTKMIGVIVPKIASASIGKVVEGILSVLNRSG